MVPSKNFWFAGISRQPRLPKEQKCILFTVLFLLYTVFKSLCLCVAGEAGFYQKVMSVCGALSRYLLSLPKLPSALQIPPATKHLITSFTTLVIEVYIFCTPLTHRLTLRLAHTHNCIGNSNMFNKWPLFMCYLLIVYVCA